MTPSVSIVIPVFNQVHWTKRCLTSLLENSEIARELFIVDNHSTDETPSYLKSMQAAFEAKGWRYQIITNSENLGFGRACNLGLKQSKSDFVTVLNNDTWLMPRWDSALVEAIERTQAALVGPYYYEKAFEQRSIEARAQRFIRRNKGKSVNFWVPMLMFFRRSALDEVGIFDERYFVTFEEIDLRVRFDKAGLKYLMVGDCFIWHASKGTRGVEGLIPSTHFTDGRKIFFDKWGFDASELYPNYHGWPERLKRRAKRIRNAFDFM